MKPFQIEVTCEEHWKLVVKEFERLEFYCGTEVITPETFRYVEIPDPIIYEVSNRCIYQNSRDKEYELITLTELRAMETPKRVTVPEAKVGESRYFDVQFDVPEGFDKVTRYRVLLNASGIERRTFDSLDEIRCVYPAIDVKADEIEVVTVLRKKGL